MKQTFYQIIITILMLLLGTNYLRAQKKDTTEFNLDNVKIIITENGDTIKNKKGKGIEGMIISIGNNGIKIGNKNKKRKHKRLHTGMHFDFGFNNVIDNTDYNKLANRDLVVVHDTTLRPLDKNDLALRNGKSINFNFWPVWFRQDIARHNVQIVSGLGFQFFNYRYSTDIRPVGTSLLDDNPIYADVTGPTQLKGKAKNKFGISYVSIPLMLRFNTNKKKGHRYFFGAGVIGSYKLKSWSKFYGNKENLDYGLNDWMLQATAEMGVTGIIKLYGTLGLQSMYRNGLDRQPFAIGIRL